MIVAAVLTTECSHQPALLLTCLRAALWTSRTGPIYGSENRESEGEKRGGGGWRRLERESRRDTRKGEEWSRR